MATRINGGDGPQQPQQPQPQQRGQQQQQQQHRPQQHQAALGLTWPPLIKPTREIDERIGRTPTSAMVSKPGFPALARTHFLIPAYHPPKNDIYKSEPPPHPNPTNLIPSSLSLKSPKANTPAPRTKTPTSHPSTCTARATPTSSRHLPRTASPPTTSTCPRTTSP